MSDVIANAMSGLRETVTNLRADLDSAESEVIELRGELEIAFKTGLLLGTALCDGKLSEYDVNRIWLQYCADNKLEL